MDNPLGPEVEVYHYIPITKEHTIRVVQLYPGSRGNPLGCKFFEVGSFLAEEDSHCPRTN
jgi:hypothetical protein